MAPLEIFRLRTIAPCTSAIRSRWSRKQIRDRSAAKWPGSKTDVYCIYTQNRNEKNRVKLYFSAYGAY